MTFLAVSLLLFIANLVAHQEAVLLLPVTGALVLAAWVRYLLQRRAAARQHQAALAKGFRPVRPDFQPRSTGPERPLRPSGPVLRRIKDCGSAGKSCACPGGSTRPAKAAPKEGKVVYATFPNTQEGRRRAMEAFSEEAPPEERQDQPLQ